MSSYACPIILMVSISLPRFHHHTIPPSPLKYSLVCCPFLLNQIEYPIQRSLPNCMTMAKAAFSRPMFFLVVMILSFNSGGTLRLIHAQKTWCLAKPSSDDATLLANINYACSEVDCSVLQRGGPCFYPDSLISHASISMNLYYQAKGRNQWNCYFSNSALIVMTDPSYGNCAYLFK